MKIWGVGVVQDEADVVAESIRWARRFCQRLVIWDLGSSDETWQVLLSVAAEDEKVQVEQKKQLRYRSALRGVIANTLRAEMSGEDWVYIFDADEFLVGNPFPVLQRAQAEGAHLVGAWQANFFPTDQTLEDIEREGERAWCSQPLERRLRHYRLEWFEWRFVRMAPELLWLTDGQYSEFRLQSGDPPRRSRYYTVVRHYRYRSPAQVRKRFERRQACRNSGAFRYETEGDFASLVKPASRLREWPPDQAELVVPGREIVIAQLRLLCWKARRRFERMMQKRAPSHIEA